MVLKNYLSFVQSTVLYFPLFPRLPNTIYIRNTYLLLKKAAINGVWSFNSSGSAKENSHPWSLPQLQCEILFGRQQIFLQLYCWMLHRLTPTLFFDICLCVQWEGAFAILHRQTNPGRKANRGQKCKINETNIWDLNLSGAKSCSQRVKEETVYSKKVQAKTHTAHQNTLGTLVGTWCWYSRWNKALWQHFLEFLPNWMRQENDNFHELCPAKTFLSLKKISFGSHFEKTHWGNSWRPDKGQKKRCFYFSQIVPCKTLFFTKK